MLQQIATVSTVFYITLHQINVQHCIFNHIPSYRLIKIGLLLYGGTIWFSTMEVPKVGDRVQTRLWAKVIQRLKSLPSPWRNYRG